MKTNTSAKSIYDECKDVAIFSKHMMRFFNFIMNISELESMHPAIKRGYKFYANEDKKKYILKLLGIIEPHIELISQYDEGIFSNDYTTTSMKLIPGIDFKNIFSILNQNTDLHKYKKQMFTHLQTIYISAEMAKNQLCKFSKVLNKQKAFLFNMVKNLGIDDSIKAKIEQLEKEEAEESADGGDFSSWFNIDKLSELKEIFGADNPIAKLLKEIMDEINKDNLTAENITHNFAEKIQKIIKIFLAKIQSKFMSGEVSMETLSSDIEGIIEKVTKIFPAIKEFISPEMIHKAFFGGSSGKTSKKNNSSNIDSDDTDTDSDAECSDTEGIDLKNLNFEEISDKMTSGMGALFEKLKESGIDLEKSQESSELMNNIKTAVGNITENLSSESGGMIDQLKSTLSQFMQ